MVAFGSRSILHLRSLEPSVENNRSIHFPLILPPTHSSLSCMYFALSYYNNLAKVLLHQDIHISHSSCLDMFVYPTNKSSIVPNFLPFNFDCAHSSSLHPITVSHCLFHSSQSTCTCRKYQPAYLKSPLVTGYRSILNGFTSVHRTGYSPV